MNIEKQIVDTFSGLAECTPWSSYIGSKDNRPARYLVFNYTELPQNFGDNDSPYVRYLIQLHYFCPLLENSRSVRRKIKNAIKTEEDFTPPQVADATDAEGQHFIFEFEALGIWEDDEPEQKDEDGPDGRM